MSTPTAAGMIAPSVGMTLPTVAPMPRWASGIRARCGWMKGMVEAVSACLRVLSSKIEAQFMTLPVRAVVGLVAVICFIVCLLGGLFGLVGAGECAERRSQAQSSQVVVSGGDLLDVVV